MIYVVETKNCSEFVASDMDSLFHLTCLLEITKQDFKVYNGGCEMKPSNFGWASNTYWKYGEEMIKSKHYDNVKL